MYYTFTKLVRKLNFTAALFTLLVLNLWNSYKAHAQCTTDLLVGQNLVKNGDFEGGYGGWTYTADPARTDGYLRFNPPATQSFSSPGFIYVGKQAETFNDAFTLAGDHTTGSGNMLMVDGICKPGIKLWEQGGIPLKPRTRYYFSVWINALKPNNNPPGSLQFTVNGDALTAAPITAPSTVGPWVQVEAEWYSGDNPTSPGVISIENTTVTGCASFVDFAIDDISFIPGCKFGTQGPTPNLGPDVTICGTNGTVTLTATLNRPSSNATIVWSAGATPVPGNPLKATVTAAGEYAICVSEAGSCTVTDVIKVLDIFDVKLNDATLCSPASTTLDAVFTGPNVQYQWYKGNQEIAGATSRTYFVNTDGTYKVKVSDSRGVCAPKEATATVTSKTVAKPVDAFYCDPGNVTLQVTPAGTNYDWYTTSTGPTLATPSAGTATNTSSFTFAVPSGTADKVFYVQDKSLSTGSLGSAVKPAGAPENISLNGIKFSAEAPFSINKMTITPYTYNDNTSVTATFRLTNVATGAVTNISAAPVIIPTAQQGATVSGYEITFPTPIQIPAAGDYILEYTNTTNSIPAYPGGDYTSYNIPDLVTMTGNTGSNPAWVNYTPGFYNWQVSYPSLCDRIPVKATYKCPPCNPPATVTAASLPVAAGTPKKVTICAGASATLSGTYTAGPGTNRNGLYSYVWYKKGSTPGAYTKVAAAGSGATGTKLVASADAGIWVLRVEDGSTEDAGCYKEDEIEVVVAPLPVVGAISPVTPVCQDSKVTLGTAGSKATSTYTWSITGTGATPASGTGQTLEVTAGSANIGVSVSEKDVNGCESASPATATIPVDLKPPLAQVGSNTLTVCALDATKKLNAVAVALPAKGVWTKDPSSSAGTAIADVNNNASEITIPGGANLKAIWTVTSGLGVCPGSNETVTVTATPAAVPSVTLSADKARICAGETVKLTAIPTQEGATPSFKLMPGNTVNSTGVFDVTPSADISYTVELTSSSLCATTPTATSAAVPVKVDALPTVATAGPNKTICTETYNLTGNQPLVGTGVWTSSDASVTFDDATKPDAEARNLTENSDGTPKKTTFTWTITNGTCPPSFKSVEITRSGKLTDATAVADKNKVCAGSPFTLTGSEPKPANGETSRWLDADSTATLATTPVKVVTLTTPGKYKYYYVIKNNDCPADSAFTIVTVEKEPDAALAGPDEPTCADSYQLKATPVTNGTGTWTVAPSAGITFTPNANDPRAVASTLASGQAYVFTWTVSNGPQAVCADKKDDVTITQAGEITSATKVATQSDTICSTDPAPLLSTSMLQPLKSDEIGAWAVTPPVAGVDISPAGQTSGLKPGDNIFTYTITKNVSGGCQPSIGTVLIRVVEPPVADITDPSGTSTNINATSYQLAANTPGQDYTGTWSIVSGQGAISNTGNLTGLTVKETNPSTGVGTTVVKWEVKDNLNACPAATDQTEIVNVDKNVANAGPDQVVCQGTVVTLNGNGTNLIPGLEGQSWTVVPVGTATGTSVTIPANTPPGTYTFTYQITNFVAGNTSDDVTVRIDETTTVPAYTGPNPLFICSEDQVLPGVKNTQALGKNWWEKISGTAVLPNDSTHNPNMTGISGVVNLKFWHKNGVCPPKETPFTVEKVGNISPAIVKISGGKADPATKQYTDFDLTDAPNRADTLCLSGSYTLTAAAYNALNEIGTWTVDSGTSVTLGGPPSLAVQTATAVSKGITKLKWEIKSTIISTCNPNSKTIYLVVHDAPEQGTVTGNPVCEGLESEFTVNGVVSSLSKYSYTWEPGSLPGAQLVTATNDKATYLLESDVAGSVSTGNISVNATNRCGTTPITGPYTIQLRPRNTTVAFVNPTMQICTSDPGPVQYSVTATPAIPAGTDYNWYWDGALLPSNTDLAQLLNSDYATRSGFIPLQVKLKNACGEAIASDNAWSPVLDVEILPSKPLEVSLLPETNNKVCVSTTGDKKFTATPNTNGNVPVSPTYEFYIGTNPAAVETNTTGVFNATGLQDEDIVKVILKDPDGCFDAPKEASASVKVEGFVNPLSTIKYSSLEECEDGPEIVLYVDKAPKTGAGSPNETGIEWYKDGVRIPGHSGFSLSLGETYQTGNYTVKVLGSVCPDSTSRNTTNVKIYAKPDFIFLQNPYVIEYAEGMKYPVPIVVTKRSADPVQHIYIPGTWLNNPESLYASIIPEKEEKEIDYFFTMQNAKCQTSKLLKVINVLPLNIPNAMTPNGDGLNDTWIIKGLGRYKDIKVSLFNRWGSRIFYDKDGYKEPWDGTNNGQPVPSGTYYYVIELAGSPNSTDRNETGSLTIIR